MDPCWTRRFGLAALLLFGLIARPAAAQPPSTAFDQLPSRVRVGDTVWVAGEDGREEKGKLWTLSPSSLEIMSNGQSKVFQAGSVRAVWTRDRDSLANGALIGLVTGVVVAALAAATCYDAYGECFAIAGLIYGGSGAAIGVGIDALTPPSKMEVFRRPVGRAARFSLAPSFSSRTQGLALRITF